MNRHRTLQLSLAALAGLAAVVLWLRFETDFLADAPITAARDIGDTVVDWVHRLRAALN